MSKIILVQNVFLIFPKGIFRAWSDQRRYPGSKDKFQFKGFIRGTHPQLQQLKDVRLQAMLEVEKNLKVAEALVEQIGFGDKCFLRKGITTKYEALHDGYTISANHQADLDPKFKIRTPLNTEYPDEAEARKDLYSGALVNVKLNIKAGEDGKGVYAYPLVVQFWGHSTPMELGTDHSSDMPTSNVDPL